MESMSSQSTYPVNKGLGQYFRLSRGNNSNETENDIFTFVELLATNTIRWELLKFFGQNPSSKKSVQAIAQGIGHNAMDVEGELDALTSLGVFNARRNGQ